MIIDFYKYQATGNDFILIDNRSGKIHLSIEQIKNLCDRKFGIGSDGLILIEQDPQLDFNLDFYNPDGSKSLCGNGTRAAVQLASSLKLVNGRADFNAFDGAHAADLMPDNTIRLEMHDVSSVSEASAGFVLNTGSPHLIVFVPHVDQIDVISEGKKIRYSEPYKKEGINVNFVELLSDNTIRVRTYERGVENETLSCGTGVTAAALAASLKGYTSPVSVKTAGGDLTVGFKTGQGGIFHDIFLQGPAKMVFQGQVEL